jgi:hypothetical protein
MLLGKVSRKKGKTGAAWLTGDQVTGTRIGRIWPRVRMPLARMLRNRPSNNRKDTFWSQVRSEQAKDPESPARTPGLKPSEVFTLADIEDANVIEVGTFRDSEARMRRARFPGTPHQKKLAY